MPPFALALAALVVLLCTSRGPAVAEAAEPPRTIDGYVLFAYDEMILKGAVGGADRGYVRGGDIGVNYAGRGQDGSPSLSYATLGPVVMDPGSTAVADSVRAPRPDGVVATLFANAVNASFAATILTAGPLPFAPPILAPQDLPPFPFTPGRALTDDAADVQVGGVGLPTPHALSPGAYRDVRVNDRATLDLAAGVYDFRSLSLGSNVTVNTTDATIVQIDRTWSINDGLRFGVGTNAGTRVHLGAFGLDAHRATACNFAHAAEIHVQLFAPTAWLDLGGTNDLYGRFWAQRITGDPGNDVTFRVPPDDPPPGGGGTPRRYQCYEIHRPTFDRRVELTDAVGGSTVVVKRAKRICAPADRDGTDPTAPADPAHLTYYTLHQTTPFTRATAEVTNELGTVTVTLAKPDRLLVPTAKRLDAPPGPPPPSIDHYKCYRLSAARTRASGLAVTDQFGSITIDVKRPLHVCLAASLDGSPIPVPGASLACYLIRGTRPAAPPPIVYTHDTFGPDQYGFFGPRDFCVPSTVAFR